MVLERVVGLYTTPCGESSAGLHEYRPVQTHVLHRTALLQIFQQPTPNAVHYTHYLHTTQYHSNASAVNSRDTQLSGGAAFRRGTSTPAPRSPSLCSGYAQRKWILLTTTPSSYFKLKHIHKFSKNSRLRSARNLSIYYQNCAHLQEFTYDTHLYATALFHHTREHGREALCCETTAAEWGRQTQRAEDLGTWVAPWWSW
jgi:hypothetical protein